jgi:hypothetical protein
MPWNVTWAITVQNDHNVRVFDTVRKNARIQVVLSVL